MELRRHGIEAVSIQFVSGVAIAAAMPYGESFFFWAAAACGIALVPLWCLMPRRGNRTAVSYIALLVLGAFCYCSARAGGSAEWNAPAFAGRALEGLCRRIDSCTLGHAGSTALLKALFTGDRSGLPRNTIATFRASGASHILALSGLHLGVIYTLLRKASGILGNSRPAELVRSLICICACSAYAVMTGAGASIVRALLFIVLNETGRLMPGRRHDALSTFCTAATIQLVLAPMSITTLSFQLSYLAMLGLVCINPVLKGFYPSGGMRGPMRRIWESAAASISCQVTTAPLAWMKFGSLPSHFLLTNLLALPLTELLMICALPMLALGSICPMQLKSLCDILAQALLWCLEIISGM